MPTPPHAREKIIAYGEERLLDDIAGGNSLLALSKSIGISQGSFANWMHDPENATRVREARMKAADLHDHQALDWIMAAEDNLALTKASQAAHHLRWRASKIAPKDYGDKQTIDGKFTVDWAQVAQEAVVKWDAKHKKPDSEE